MVNTNQRSPAQTYDPKTLDTILKEIRCLTTIGKELCLTFPDYDGQRIWVHVTHDNIFLADVEYRPVEQTYGFRATMTEDQMIQLLAAHTAFACGKRDIAEGGEHNA